MKDSFLGLGLGVIYFYCWGFPNGMKKPPRLHPNIPIIPHLLSVEKGMIFFYFRRNRYHLHHWFVSVLAMIALLYMDPFTYRDTIFSFFSVGLVHGLQVYMDRFEFLENH